MADESLLSLEARRAIRDERRASMARHRTVERIEGRRRARAEELQATEASQVATELEAAAAVIPNPYEAIASPWSRAELVVLGMVGLIAGMLGMLGGVVFTALVAAALGTGTLLLVRHLACASLDSGTQPRAKVLGCVVCACAMTYGFVVGAPFGGWTAVAAGALASVLLGAAAVTFAAPWALRAREMWRERELRDRRVALERTAVVHAAHAERLRKETEADAA